jgi:hypothetical protein
MQEQVMARAAEQRASRKFSARNLVKLVPKPPAWRGGGFLVVPTNYT